MFDKYLNDMCKNVGPKLGHRLQCSNQIYQLIAN